MAIWTNVFSAPHTAAAAAAGTVSKNDEWWWHFPSSSHPPPDVLYVRWPDVVNALIPRGWHNFYYTTLMKTLRLIEEGEDGDSDEERPERECKIK